jgi:hypothetical protein
MSSAVCLIAKNEERAIAEWLAYQLVIGFDRIYVYDNESDTGDRQGGCRQGSRNCCSSTSVAADHLLGRKNVAA